MRTIYTNGKIYTVDKDMPWAQAVVVEDNIIRYVGNNDEAMKYEEKHSSIVNLNNKFMCPGFNDSHMHLLHYGNVLNYVDLVGVKSVEEIIKRSKQYIQDNDLSDGDWILGMGWNQDKFDKVMLPTKEDMDKISTTMPIMLRRACAHVTVLNSKAIELSHIDQKIDEIGREYIEIKDGEMTGIIKERAVKYVSNLLPIPSAGKLANRIELAANKMRSFGITSIHSDDFCVFGYEHKDIVLEAYKILLEQNRLPVRLYQQCYIKDADSIDNVCSLIRKYKGDEYFKLGALKLLLDGSLGARTALMSEDYADMPGERGVVTFTQTELDSIIEKAHKENVQTAIHCIGDGAINMYLESIDNLKYKHNKLRHGIVHCQITTDKIVKRIKDKELITYIQPIFLDSDVHIVRDRVGEKANTSYLYKTFIDKEIVAPYSSDCPVDTPNVMKGMHCAVNRTDVNNQPQGGYLPQETISIEEAISAYTELGAYASFEEKIKGKIKEGMLADMVIFDNNLLEIESTELKNQKPIAIVFDGRYYSL